jgi:SagB-type dehydrogenase family enzyme
MRRLVALLVVCVAIGTGALIGIGADATEATTQEVTLPAPVTKGTMSLEEAIAKRRSMRGFQTRALTEQQIGQLLWAAQGITDPASGHRAAPSAMAMYPLTVYVFRSDGVFAYEPKGHKLVRISDQDRRAEVTQPPRGGEAAPVTFLFTGDRSKMGSRMGAMADRFIYLEAGHAAENLVLEAAALGLATVTQGGINEQAAAKALGLPESALVIYAMPVGYAAAQAAVADATHSPELTVGEAAPSALEADSSAWVDVMPSADLNGWSRVPVPPGASLGKQQWRVEEQGKLLVCEGDGGHDMLLCDREFGDAVFHCEFRFTKVEGKTGYNSGVYVRNSKDGAIWHQAQIGDGNGGYLFGETPGADGQSRFFTTAAEVKDGRVKPAGEWNTLEITAHGSVLTLWVNGAVTCKVNDCGNPKGRVGVEGEGYRIEFRNLKVKELQ